MERTLKFSENRKQRINGWNESYLNERRKSQVSPRDSYQSEFDVCGGSFVRLKLVVITG